VGVVVGRGDADEGSILGGKLVGGVAGLVKQAELVPRLEMLVLVAVGELEVDGDGVVVCRGVMARWGRSRRATCGRRL
jgi:hypothetical protein